MELDGLTPIAARLITDTAALVLIWLVQLIIYPAFLHFQRAGFTIWHRAYTRKVTYVVMPIMLSQLGVYAYLLFVSFDLLLALNTVLILLAWAITFLRAVPLHGALDVEEDHLPLAAQLVAVNWWRTIIWSAVWVITVIVSLR